MITKIKMFIYSIEQQHYHALMEDCYDKALHYHNNGDFDMAGYWIAQGNNYLTKECELASKALEMAL